MMHRLLRYLVLPAEITKVERLHLARINRIAVVATSPSSSSSRLSTTPIPSWRRSSAP